MRTTLAILTGLIVFLCQLRELLAWVVDTIWAMATFATYLLAHCTFLFYPNSPSGHLSVTSSIPSSY